MATCKRYKTTKDKYGRKVRRCADFGESSLARHPGRRPMGALPEVWEGYGGAGSFRWDLVFGPVLGGGVSLGVGLLTRAFAAPGGTASRYAGLIGGGAGAVASLPLGFLRGWDTAVAGVISAAFGGLLTWLSGVVAPAGSAEMAGYGLITPEEVEGYGLITPKEVEGYGLITPEEIQGVDIYEGYGVGDTGEAVEVLEGVNFAAFGTRIGR
jgi:hypothetical protein